MRTLSRNQQKLKYSLLVGEEDELQLDDNGNPIIVYVDSDGKEHYAVTGEKRLVYSSPTDFEGNISLTSGMSEVIEYGIDKSAYDGLLVVEKGAVPLSETSLIWYTSEPSFTNGSVDPKSADFRVKAPRPTLNEIKYILERLVN